MGVLRAIDHIGHILQPYRCTVAESDDDRLVLVAREKLIISADGVRLARPIDHALRLIHIGLRHGRANIFQAQPVRGERRRVHLNPHRGLLSATNGNQSHSRQLRNFLRQRGVGEILHLRQRQ